MTAAAIAAAAVVGLIAGAGVGLAADAIATPRYGAGTEGYDPADRALSPLRVPTTKPVHVAGALVCAAAFASLAAAWEQAELVVPLCVLGWILVVASIIDLQYLRLPNVLTLGGAVVVAALAVAMSIRLDAADAILGAALGAAGYPAFLFGFAVLLEALAGRSGLGLGDVKLAVPLGLTAGWVGWRDELAVLGSIRAVLLAALIGSFLGALGGLALTRLQPKRSYPFGPFLAAGWLIAVVIS